MPESAEYNAAPRAYLIDASVFVFRTISASTGWSGR